jgi:hypothetical protein
MNVLTPIVALLNVALLALRTAGVPLVLVVLGSPRWAGSV